MRIKSKISLLACALFLAGLVALAGCTEERIPPKQTEREKPLIGVLLYRADDAYISYVTQSLKRHFEVAGVDLLLYDGNNKQLTQDEQLLLMLETKADALAINLVDVQSASFVVDKVKKADIPVVFFNREPSLDDLKAYEKAYFVGTVLQDAGRMQGEIIAQLWNNHPEMDRNKDGCLQYIMIQANSDNPESLARTEYSVKQARETGVAMEQVGNTFMCGWDEERSYQALRTVLPQIIDSFELVIANNDAMALGAVRALQEVGFNAYVDKVGKGDGGENDRYSDKYIPVIGVDATPQALLAIGAGAMAGTVRQDSEGMGEAVVALLMNAVYSRPLLEGINLEWDESGIALRVPYSMVGEKEED